MEKEQIVWLKKKEYVDEMRTFAKVLYFLGIIKQKRHKKYEGHPYQVYSGRCYRAVFGIRWYNPLSIVFCIGAYIVALVFYISKAMLLAFDDVLYLNRREVKVETPLRSVKK